MTRIVLGDISYVEPINLFADSKGILGENTCYFTSNGQTIFTIGNNICLIQLDSLDYKVNQNDDNTYSKIVIGSITYQTIQLINREDYKKYGIFNIFGDFQLVFISSEGLFITQFDKIISLSKTIKT